MKTKNYKIYCLTLLPYISGFSIAKRRFLVKVGTYYPDASAMLDY